MLDQIGAATPVEREQYRTRLPELQARLYDLEQALIEARVPVLIVFEGWAGTSKIGAIRVLTRRLDPRGLRVHSITPPRTYEQHYPWLYRFWQKIPSYGQIAIFDRSWYRQVIAERSREGLADAAWHARCEDIAAFERQLAGDGSILIKFWLQISRKEQAQRFRKLRKNPLTAWQVTEDDAWQQRNYKQVRDAVSDLLARTDAPHAPWTVLPAAERRFVRLAILETVVRRLQARLGAVEALHAAANDDAFDQSGPALRREQEQQQMMPSDGRIAAVAFEPSESSSLPAILQPIDLNQAVDDKWYTRKLARLQAKLYLLGLQVYRKQRPVVLLFEGWDAAGKGGAIQRVTEQLDPRAYVVHAIAAPGGDDKVHHYLYRFWRRLPARGSIAIFDRSWYGRVLVERIEGFARPDEWRRAYAEINEFERQLTDFGTIVCKFWLHISPQEQLRRFEERQTTTHKAWKLTEEDWRNREKWPLYIAAADEMLLRTSTPGAPWTIVEAENKRYARIKVLRTVVKRLESELGRVRL